MRQELYRGDIYMVVHSPEEKAARMAEGWSEIMQPDVKYRFNQHVHPDELTAKQVAAIESQPDVAPEVAEVFESKPAPAADVFAVDIPHNARLGDSVNLPKPKKGRR